MAAARVAMCAKARQLLAAWIWYTAALINGVRTESGSRIDTARAARRKRLRRGAGWVTGC